VRISGLELLGRRKAAGRAWLRIASPHSPRRRVGDVVPAFAVTPTTPADRRALAAAQAKRDRRRDRNLKTNKGIQP
jgi:hypothetical protein